MTSALSMAQWLVVPLVLHILLTFVVGTLSLQARIAAVRSNRALLKATALDNSAWPDEARKFSNNFDNQFQVPMLAYTAVAVFLATGTADAVAVLLMWAFIAARLMHTLEHTRRNNVVRRLSHFFVSYAAVIALWLWFALRFLVIG